MVKAIWKNGAFLKILFLTENKQLQKTYQDEFVKGNLLDALAEMIRLDESMVLGNMVYYQTYCGTQYGCELAEYKNEYIIHKILKKRAENDERYKKPDESKLMESYNESFY